MTEDQAAARTIDMFRALAHPLRLALVRALADRDLAVHELVDIVDAPQPRVSQHLGVLRSARLVRTHREGREVRYHLTDEHVAHIVADAVQHAVEHGD